MSDGEIPLPSFTTADEYLGRATHASLRAPIGTDKVDFIIGEQHIPGVREVQQDTEEPKFEIWHPSQQPTASGVMTAKVDDHDEVTAQIALHDMLVPKATQVGDSLEVRGSAIGSVLPGTILTVAFNGSVSQAIDCTGGCGNDTLLITLPLADVASGDYIVQLHFSDAGGEIGTTEVSTSVTWPAKSEVEDTIIPVTKPTVYVTKLDVVPISSLSTQFSTPVSPTLAAAISGMDALQSTSEPLVSDVKGAAASQSNPLNHVSALDTDRASSEIPVAATGGGWSVFGLSWYWWASGAVASWLAVMATRWWLR